MERAKYKTSVAEISIGESPTGTVVIWTTVFFYYEGEFPDVEDLVLRNNPKRSGIKVDHGVEKLHEDKRIGPPKKREMFVKIKDRHKEYIKNGVNIVISNNDGLPRVSLKVDSTVTKQARYLLSNNNITEKVKISK